MTEGRGRVFSRGLSLRLQEGLGGGLFAGSRTSPEADIPVRLGWGGLLEQGATSLGWRQQTGARGQPCGRASSRSGSPKGAREMLASRDGGGGCTYQAQSGP